MNLFLLSILYWSSAVIGGMGLVAMIIYIVWGTTWLRRGRQPDNLNYLFGVAVVLLLIAIVLLVLEITRISATSR